MAFGNEIKFKIAGDFSTLEKGAEKSAAKVTRSLDKVDRAVKKVSNSGLSLERARSALEKARERRLYDEANTVGKIRIITRELQDYAFARDRSAKNTVGHMKAQLAIEQRMTTLRKLQGQAMGEGLAGGSGGGGGGGNGRGGPSRVAVLGVVAGVIGAIESVLSGWRNSRVQVDEARGQAIATGTASMRANFASRRGLQGQLEQGQGNMRDLENKRVFAKQRADYLSGGAQGVLSAINPEELTKAQVELAEIDGQIQQQHDENQRTERELKRVTAQYENQLATVEAINAARATGLANEHSLAGLLEEEAEETVKIEKAHGNPQSVQAALLALEQARGATAAAGQAQQAEVGPLRRQFSEQALEGRTFRNGQRRPRSETERLAARAAGFRERANQNILTGAKQGVAENMTWAARSEGAVASRLSDATSTVPRKDVADISKLDKRLENTNQILTAMKALWQPTDMTAGKK